MDAAPKFPDAARRAQVRACLASAGYRDDVLRDRLRAQNAPFVRALPRAVLERRIAAADEPLTTLLRLFLLCEAVSTRTVDEALGVDGRAAMEASGMMVSDRDITRPTLRLSTLGSDLFASDLPEHHAAKARDFVLGPFGVTLKLADYTIREPVRSTLDLGCGSGALAALAAAHSDVVVATDINARAVDFCRFNAELNGLGHLSCREGSLFEPVAGERFDLIVCNPPYVISPSNTFVYRDAGTELCRRVVEEAPEHLEDGGRMQMMVEWPQRAGAEWSAEVGGWLEGIACDAWLLRLYTWSANEYADIWLAQEYRNGTPPEGARDEWVEHLRVLGVDSVAGGLLTMRRERRARQIRTLRDAPKMSEGPIGDALARWTDSQTLLASVAEPRELLDVVLRPAPELKRHEEHAPTGDGWTSALRELRLESGLRFGAKVDPVAEEIVGLLDGKRTPREALMRLAARHGVSPDPFIEGLPKALVRLLELGLLVPTARAE